MIYFRVNGARVYLDVEAFREGRFRVERGTMSEQCEDCAEDVVESCNLRSGNYGDAYVVQCECGTTYPIREED